MSVAILTDRVENKSVFYDNTSDTALPMIVLDSDQYEELEDHAFLDSTELAQKFLVSVEPLDMRTFTEPELSTKFEEFVAEISTEEDEDDEEDEDMEDK